MQDNQATMSYRITALESAMKVLKIIGQHPGLHASQIAQHTGLTKSRVFHVDRASVHFILLKTWLRF